MSLVSAWDDAETVVLGAPDSPWSGPPSLGGLEGTPAEEMMAWDTLSTLPDEMLVKVDRASMAFGLEVRPPLVDHKVVEAAWNLPPSLRIRGGVGKRALRLLVERHVPRHLIDRPKTGFDPPLGAWLRGPLRGWAEDHLAESRLRDQGLLRPGGGASLLGRAPGRAARPGIPTLGRPGLRGLARRNGRLELLEVLAKRRSAQAAVNHRPVGQPSSLGMDAIKWSGTAS